MLISRKPYCNWCQNRGHSPFGEYDYKLYSCSCEELAKLYPERVKDGIFMVTEKMRCPNKNFFKPLYTLEQVKQHNNHK